MDIPVNLPGMEGQNVAVRPASFTGAKLLLNGQPVTKQKGFFNLRSNSGSTVAVKFKLRPLDPIPNLLVGGQTIQLAPALLWYQYLWLSIPVIMVFFGGAIGGMCGGMAAFMSAQIFRGQRSEAAKYALSGLISLAAFFTYFVITATILAALRK